LESIIVKRGAFLESVAAACAHLGDRVERDLSFCRWGSPFDRSAGLLRALPRMSDRKSRLITICMLAGAIVMIGLVLTGTLNTPASTTPTM
jgi:hypothetical protein